MKICALLCNIYFCLKSVQHTQNWIHRCKIDELLEIYATLIKEPSTDAVILYFITRNIKNVTLSTVQEENVEAATKIDMLKWMLNHLGMLFVQQFE